MTTERRWRQRIGLEPVPFWLGVWIGFWALIALYYPYKPICVRCGAKECVCDREDGDESECL